MLELYYSNDQYRQRKAGSTLVHPKPNPGKKDDQIENKVKENDILTDEDLEQVSGGAVNKNGKGKKGGNLIEESPFPNNLR